MKIKDLLREGDNFGMSSEQRKLANLGRVLMHQATSTKDDALANTMAKVGNELTNFGATFGPKNLKDLVKKTDTPAPVIQKLLAYADKIYKAKNDLRKDHNDGGLNDSIHETTSAGAIASTGNGFANGGIGTISRAGTVTPKKKKKKAEEGFASDAQRRAAFASGYDPKKKKNKS